MNLKTRLLRACLAALALCAFALQPALACTSLVITAADGSRVYGRTMEFAFPLESDAIVIPRKHAFTGTAANGQKGLAWTAKYAATGLNAYGIPVLIDGMNERGLAGGILYFPDFAKYADPAAVKAEQSLAPWEFLTWALTNFATVDEVKAALVGVTVVALNQPGANFIPPFHYTLHDASGGSIVVEPIDGKLIVHDNPFGVMTNAPPFPWHVQNLSNYVKLTRDDPPPLKIFGQTIKAVSTGAGMLGVPGDLTAPSRFVRAIAYASSVVPPPNAEETVRLTEHVMNNFDIPLGYQRGSAGPSAPMERTQWTTVSDLKNARFYFKTIDYQALRQIDLRTLDLDSVGIKTFKLASPYTIPKVDVK